MSEPNASIYVALITSLAALGVAISNAWITRKMNTANAIKATAEAEKIKEEAAAIATKEWRELYMKMQQRCDQYDRKIAELEGKLDIQNEYIGYLFDGITVLVDQIEGMGEEPHFRPRPTFRGKSGNEFDFGG